MILTCPSCATRYMAEAVSFQPSGRMVRCVHCGHGWFQSPPSHLSMKALPDHTDSGGQNLGEFIPRAAQSQRFFLVGQIVGWVLLLCTIIGISAGAYTYRVEIVGLWPEASTLYSALGLPVNTRGLAFRNASYQEETYDGVPALVVMGEIINTTNTPQLIPNIRISLRDRKSREIFDWTTDPPVDEIAAGEVQSFAARLTRPPQHAQDLVIRFAARSETRSD